MALRKYMHGRNKYKSGIDFKKLAVLYPDFCKHTTTDLTGKLRYNFKSEESLRILAKTLLKHDFDLDVEIPMEKLVPVVPLRLNYILWIEDLLAHAKSSSDIHGIDIGTGAICIYPLLCAKLYGWKMVGTEICETSIASANKNIARNNLNDLIKVILVKDYEKASILKESLDKDPTKSYSFTMCNPPFFDADKSPKKEKRLPPRNAPTGTKTELHVEGGEKSFIMRLINESLELGERVRIYTTMLGQKKSCAFFRSELKKMNIENSTWTEFCQGHTKRWGLAWTLASKTIFDLTKAPVIRTRDDSQAVKQSKDRPCEMVFPLGGKFNSLDELILSLKAWIQELRIEMSDLDMPQNKFNGWTCRLRAIEDRWSHARRKRRLAQRRVESMKKPRLENSKEISVQNECSDPEEDCGTNVDRHESTTSSTSSSLLELSLIVGKIEDSDNATEMIKLCMIYEGGHGGKQALETFRQYIINKLSIREYLTSHSVSKNKRKNKTGVL